MGSTPSTEPAFNLQETTVNTELGQMAIGIGVLISNQKHPEQFAEHGLLDGLTYFLSYYAIASRSLTPIAVIDMKTNQVVGLVALYHDTTTNKRYIGGVNVDSRYASTNEVRRAAEIKFNARSDSVGQFVSAFFPDESAVTRNMHIYTSVAKRFLKRY